MSSSNSNSTTDHSKWKFKLNTGDQIPAIGLGTWQSSPGQVTEAVKTALQAGYRHIDTAFAYGNEKEVGQGIKDSGVPREEIWITTKLENKWHYNVEEGFRKSLESLGVDYVDLYLMHWPAATDPKDGKKLVPNWTYVNTWLEMQKLPASGHVKNIGVSNWGPHHFEELEKHPEYKITPAVNQVELHPNNPSPKYLDYFKAKGVHLTAYSCLGSTNSPLYKAEDLKKLAERKGKTVQQILLVWGIQRGTSVIPKSVTASRIKANLDIDGWELSSEDVNQINNLQGRFKVCNDEWLPQGAKAFYGDDE